MSRSNHAGKNPREKQRYSDATTHISGEPTVEDEYAEISSQGSDVPAPTEGKVRVPPPKKPRQRPKGITEHFRKHLPVYISSLLTSILGVLLAFSIPAWVDIARIKDQIQSEKESLVNTQQDLEQLRRDSQNGDVDILNKINDITLRMQDQIFRIQSLEKQLNKIIP